MAEQELSNLVMNFASWVESLHEKNLKYKAQVESLSRDLAREKDSNKELVAKLTAYQKINQQSPHIHQGIEETMDLVQQQQLQQMTTPVPTTRSTSIHQQQANGLDQQHQVASIVTSDHHQILDSRHTQDHHQQHVLHQLAVGETSPHVMGQQPHHTQVIYQPIPMASGPSFVSQPQYVWTAYDSTPSSGLGGYYDQYGGPTPSTMLAPATAFVQSQPLE